MADNWPSSLPSSLSGFALKPGDGRARSGMDRGPPKVRRRSSSMPRQVTGTLVMTSAEWVVFEAFCRVTLAEYSLPFNFPSQLGSGTWLVRFGETLPTRNQFGIDAVSVNMDLEWLP